jgi:putative ABC transport system substrate-binding protein
VISRRKVLIALAAGALAPTALRAQPAARIPRIGVLASTQNSLLDSFYQGLRDHGYVEGKNILLERRFTGNDVSKALALAQELAALKVDVIFAPSSTFVEAARQATAQIPIVFSSHNDPVGSGHIASLARPGGNITGVSQMATELNAKQLELVRELLPRAARVAVLSNPTTPSHVPALKEVEQAGRKLGFKLHMIEASSPEQLELAFDAAAKAGDQALLLLTSPLSFSEHKRIATLALKHRLPAIFAQSQYVDAGGLISYGPNLTENFHRAAAYVDRILKGANPATMAVEQPTKFELVINFKTAKAIGIKIPQSILVRTDKVIE